MTLTSKTLAISRWLVFLGSWLIFAQTVSAATLYYVDPDAAGSQTGSASQPWRSLTSAAWATINARLAVDDVTVYFSARAASSDTNQASTTGINIQRTDMSTHRLTLDGMSFYNTSDAAPSWSPYTGSSRFQVTTTYPAGTANFSSNAEMNFWTLRGFKIIATNGQALFTTAIRNVIIEDNEFVQDLTGVALANRTGPGVIVGKSDITGSFAGANVTIRRNVIHNTFGECLYIGGWYGQPPGVGAGDTLLIEDNVIYDCGLWGEEGDGIDIKDAWTNVTIRNNTVYQTTPGSIPTSRDGIITISAALIEGNTVYNMGRQGISLDAFYGTFDGFWTGSIVRNNVVMNCGNTHPDDWAHGIAYPERVGAFAHVTPQIYNNTVYGCKRNGQPGIARGIYIGPTVTTTVSVYNNISAGTDGIDFEAPTGKLSQHGNNNYWHTGSGAVARYGNPTYTPSTITSFEIDSLSTDPRFVNTAPPYTRGHFALQITSPLCARNMGAIPCGSGSVPQAPTNPRLQ